MGGRGICDRSIVIVTTSKTARRIVGRKVESASGGEGYPMTVTFVRLIVWNQEY